MRNQLLEIFEDPLREHTNLTDKEREAGRLASLGNTNDEIAELMGYLNTSAVGSLLRKIHWKTGMGKNALVKNFIEQIRKAIQ